MRDIDIILDYFEHLRERLEPEYISQCASKKLDPEDSRSPENTKCVWADYLMAKRTYAARPLGRICNYLIETEKKDFLENYPEAAKGFTKKEELEFLETATHIFPVAIRCSGFSLFDFGINRIKTLKVDLDLIKRELKKSGVLNQAKPEDSLLTMDFNGNDDLFISIDWDEGPAGTINCAVITVKQNGQCSLEVGRGFRCGDPEEDKHVERCVRKMFHRVNDAVRRDS